MPRRSSRTPGMALREALDVQLVDHRLVPRRLGRPVVLPVEAPGRSRRTSGSRRASSSGSGESPSSAPGGYGNARAASQSTAPSIAFAYGSISSFAGLKRCPSLGRVRAVDAVAVALARARRPAGSRASRGRCARVSSCRSSRPSSPKRQSSTRLGMLGEEREVRSLTVASGRQREGRRARVRYPGQTLHWPSGTSQSTASGGSVSSAENGWPCHGTLLGRDARRSAGAPAAVALERPCSGARARRPPRGRPTPVARRGRRRRSCTRRRAPGCRRRTGARTRARSPRRRRPRATRKPDGSKSRSQSAGSAR